MLLTRSTIQPIIDLALREDIGTGDVTTTLTVSATQCAAAEIAAKEPGVIAGLAVARWVFETLEPELEFQALIDEGSRAKAASDSYQVVARLRGRAQALLTGERVALNFLQRMSGIATLTARMVAAARTGAKNARLSAAPQILDTRKTTPGLRVLEKYAVRVGGGTNHRFGLYDAVLIKDNHIAAAGGIKQAVTQVRAGASPMMRIEVEVKNSTELDEALAVRADIIMLDNMTVDAIKDSVERVAGRAKLEVSGGVNEATIGAIAATDVDYISIGALTHSAPALDMAMKIVDG